METGSPKLVIEGLDKVSIVNLCETYDRSVLLLTQCLITVVGRLVVE